jgi:hypothetical protein
MEFKQKALFSLSFCHYSRNHFRVNAEKSSTKKVQPKGVRRSGPVIQARLFQAHFYWA